MFRAILFLHPISCILTFLHKKNAYSRYSIYIIYNYIPPFLPPNNFFVIIPNTYCSQYNYSYTHICKFVSLQEMRL
jgi:hypothetical protein